MVLAIDSSVDASTEQLTQPSSTYSINIATHILFTAVVNFIWCWQIVIMGCCFFANFMTTVKNEAYCKSDLVSVGFISVRRGIMTFLCLMYIFIAFLLL